MKILLVNKYHFPQGGADRAYLDMADVLTRAGHEVAFFSMQHPKNLPTKWSEYFVSNAEYGDSENLRVFQRLQLAFRILWNREAKRNMERLIQDFRPDIAHLHNIYHQLSPSILSPLRKAGVPVVMTLHDYKLVSPNYNVFVRGNLWEETKNGKYWTCVRDRCVKDSYAKSLVCATEAYLHRFLGSYDSIRAFLSPSRFLIQKFQEFGFKHPIEYLSNPLVPFPENIFEDAPSKDAPFVFIGRLSVEKGVEKILYALKGLDDSYTVRIVGDGPDRARLEALVDKLDVSARVVFRGFLSGLELEWERRSARAILLPSLWYENMPYALTEALGEGAIVIAARRGGIPERVRDGENGFLFDPENPASLVETMHRVQTLDEISLRNIRKSARKSVEDLREEIFVKNIESLYKKCSESY
jgi:glycosyltransferase involved in cell wall biosynthesis